MTILTETRRATLDELKEFANKVREAGGGNPLDALMPAVPQDPSQCLIAKNLNFNCEVDGISPLQATEYGLDETCSWWCMSLTDEATRDKIAESLELKTFNNVNDVGDSCYCVVLPLEIGKVAADFDDTIELNDQELLDEFWPYIEASTQEAMEQSEYITKDGKIVT